MTHVPLSFFFHGACVKLVHRELHQVGVFDHKVVTILQQCIQLHFVIFNRHLMFLMDEIQCAQSTLHRLNQRVSGGRGVVLLSLCVA